MSHNKVQPEPGLINCVCAETGGKELTVAAVFEDWKTTCVAAPVPGKIFLGLASVDIACAKLEILGAERFTKQYRGSDDA